MFDAIPRERPETPLLDEIDDPARLRKLPLDALPELAEELRAFLLWSVGQTGGHFGAGLGVVELSIALHYCYDTPQDRLVWDVGHQSYPHKILTGRREALTTIRQRHGLAAFPSRQESIYDTFGVGHSSTSISAALGMALAARRQGRRRHVCAIIGDGAMTAGLAFEGLSHAAHAGADMLVVLNDNDMSISRNVGGFSNYLARIWASRSYIALREGGKRVLATMPSTLDFARRTEESFKHLLQAPGALFESIGFNYVGPIDGHNLAELVETISNLRSAPGPQLLHIYTTKGKGFAPAEADPIGYHAITKMDAPRPETPPARRGEKFSKVFGDWLCAMARTDSRLVAITPAMCEGSGMQDFAHEFPERYHDVAIAEQHALTLAAGLACEGEKPVVAIYSTFLQRGYDQLIHDIALQNLDVTFGVDRAGLVGEDGPTHSGVFDIAFLRTVPNVLIMTPSDEAECRAMLSTAFAHRGPAAVRYPRGTGCGASIPAHLDPLPLGRARIERRGQEIAILVFGPLLHSLRELAERLQASLVDMRFVRPLDVDLVLAMATEHRLLVTVEEHQIAGGAGSAVAECLHQAGRTTPLLMLGIPDRFIEHGTPAQMLVDAGLDADSIALRIQERFQSLAP